MATGATLTGNTGLRGIVAGDTAICTVGAVADSLHYRGYDVAALAADATFEEVAYLLLYGELPDVRQLHRFTDRLAGHRALPSPIIELLERLPADSHPMDVLRTGCSALGAIEPEVSLGEEKAYERLLAALPSILGYWHRFVSDGERIDPSEGDPSIASRLLRTLSDKEPTEDAHRFLDASLTLYAEHEFNASTFTARVIAATLADLHSAITGAIGALRGPLHGGANEAAMALVEQFRSPDEAVAAVTEMLTRKVKIMGFGHAVYKRHDPRSPILKEWSKRLSTSSEDGHLFAVSEAIELLMRREKGLFPNADFYCATGYHFLGLPTQLFTPIFAIARISGWCAHVKEQRSNNKLIRPSGNYTGPPHRAFAPLFAR